MSSNRGPNALIQQLLKAEEEAEVVVNRAKENRVKMLKEARFSAEEELKHFKSREEERFKKEFEEKFSLEDAVVAQLEGKTKEEIEVVRADYAKNAEAVMQYISSKVFEVEICISERLKSCVKREG